MISKINWSCDFSAAADSVGKCQTCLLTCTRFYVFATCTFSDNHISVSALIITKFFREYFFVSFLWGLILSQNHAPWRQQPTSQSYFPSLRSIPTMMFWQSNFSSRFYWRQILNYRKYRFQKKWWEKFLSLQTKDEKKRKKNFSRSGTKIVFSENPSNVKNIVAG